ncbi:hypothetical protein PTSG_12841 [Salpingoeca rosetta]|uniref:Mini-chromosome maintenance complex-binding protein n=1 Tax=Salpingoeca rosetta (strain ATCC 50818 / BSB-021) TaxID=946362 RepID=F2UMY6_SALR5|nr:uncharacterized protein PTSG_12841 [Salpingoeca rosetta]EGD78485.1 hypothetical protein PTSG_12841 [Salpingoeca rosetta]|eukprot:XP_004989434.1 hypothetical protein PTSG_12841 [Salpingoeca rosetta]
MDVKRPLEAIDAAFVEIVQAGAPAGSFSLPDELMQQVIDARDQIPSLHDVDRMYLPPNSLVRFRGMIQATHNPEIYLDVYATRGPQGETAVHTSRYRDMTNTKEDWEIDFDSQHNVYKSRHTLHCVPIPAENTWVRQHLAASAPQTARVAGERVRPGATKRATMDEGDDDDDDDGDGGDDDGDGRGRGMEMDAEQQQQQQFPAKKRAGDMTATTIDDDGDSHQQHGQAPGARVADEHVHNLPLPDDRTPALLKVYGDDPGVKLHEMVEVIGVYVNDPTPPSALTDEERAFAEPLPPSSVLPRIHCIHMRTIQHHNPLIPPQLAHLNHVATALPGAAVDARPPLHRALLALVGGDDLTATLLLLHLISRVHTRTADGTMTLGQFPLNLFGVTGPLADLPARLDAFLSTITTSSHLLDMSLRSLNTMSMNPKRSGSTDKLSAGFLQLPRHAHVILNETAMEAGQLNERGIANLMALKTAMDTQQVAFEFEHAGSIMFDIDVQLLVLSEGKSMLPVSTKVPIAPTADVTAPQLTDDETDAIRAYLDLAKHAEFTIAEEMQEAISSDFSTMRQEDPSITADALHRLLGIARLVSLSYGRSSLDLDGWTEAKRIDAAVTQRMHAQ